MNQRAYSLHNFYSKLFVFGHNVISEMRLTARAMTPVMIPVLMAIERYSDPKASSNKDGGFNPFFKCPICRGKKKNPTKINKY